jgi:peptidoglycan/xylan/chitin deacetylase (PgdA/CDA1 family)
MKTVAACIFVFVAVAGVTCAQSAPPAPSVTVTRWPQDRSSAISLTFDDGINTDLDFVGPILKRHHLTGTFFIATAFGPWEKRKPEWKQLALDGNELANHTVHHPCLLSQITPHSQDYTPAMFEAEIRDAANDLTTFLNSSRGLTFAYPCGNMSFGKPQDEVANAALYLRYVAEHSFAARAVGSGSPVNPDEFNILAINDLGPTAGKNFPALLAMAEPALASRNWGVYCFHGVGGDWLAITPEALDELASYLEHHSEVWSAPFGDVVRYIQERKSLSIQIAASNPNSLDLALQWPMDKHIYDLPLTLKVQLPSVWTSVAASVDGKPLQARIIPAPFIPYGRAAAAASGNSAASAANSSAASTAYATTILLDVPAQTKSLRLSSSPP